MRVEIPAIENNQIFEATGNKQLSVSEEPQVTGAKETSVTAGRKMALEGCSCFFRPVPISLSHARAAHPDFSNTARFARLQRIGVHDLDLLAGKHSSASDKHSHR